MSSLGLYLMGARWYDPQLGRWISPDTMVPDPADPQSLNRYSYVVGNPLRYRDPTGHWEEEWEEQFEQEHGRPPTEQDWWDYQFSLQVISFGSWGWIASYTIRTDLYSAAVSIASEGVGWLRTQVEDLHKGVMAMVSWMGGSTNYRRAVGSKTFKRINRVKWTNQAEGQYSSMTSYLPACAVIDVWNFPDAEGGTARSLSVENIVHELAHHWDSVLAYEPSRILTGSANPTEQWASAVSYYIAGTGPLTGYERGLIVTALRHPTDPVFWYWDYLYGRWH